MPSGREAMAEGGLPGERAERSRLVPDSGGARVSSLKDWKKTGAKGSRTPDLVIANDALSRLSYSPIGACLPWVLLAVKARAQEYWWDSGIGRGLMWGLIGLCRSGSHAATRRAPGAGVV